MSSTIYINVQNVLNRAVLQAGANEMAVVLQYNEAVKVLHATATSRPFFDINEVRALRAMVDDMAAKAVYIARECRFTETQTAIRASWRQVVAVVNAVEERRYKGPFSKRVREMVQDMGRSVIAADHLIATA